MPASLPTLDEFEAAVERVVRRVLSDRQGPELLTPAEAAAKVGVKPRTVRAWIRSGRLPRAGHGRRVLVRRADLERARERPEGVAKGMLKTLEDGR